MRERPGVRTVPRRRARRVLVVAALALGAGCADLSPPSLTVSADRTGASATLYRDDFGLGADSTVVRIAGPGADTAAWTARHGGGAWLVLEDSAGASGSLLRWTRDVSLVPGPGTYVDTISAVVAGVSMPILVDSLIVADRPTQYVTERRAWLPGERDALIARIARTRQLSLPYVGDLSDNAADILPLDSITRIVPVPPQAPRAVARAPMVPGTGWSAIGLDLRIINTNPVPDDTLRWLGWLWFNDADSTNKGIVLAYRALSSNTIGATTVNTTTFDAAYGKSGAGGGEVSGLPGPSLTYWQANGWVRRNTMSVTLNFAFTGASTITSGPYLGGSQRTSLMTGALDSVRLDRVSGSGTPATQYASINFGFTGGVQITCVFPSPCTTNTLRLSPEARAWLRAGGAGPEAAGPARR